MNLISNIFHPSPVFAQEIWSNRCATTVTDPESGEIFKVATIQGFECLFANIAQVVIYFAGIVFFIMLIKGGFSYLTSSGDQKKTAKATSTLTLSIIGLIGVVLSFLILKFIYSFTGVNVTEFNIPG
jgi:Type IV secretion system pilin